MLGELPEIGSSVMLGGYQQNHPLILTADSGSRIIGWATDARGRRLLHHNCTETRGVSVAPLLIAWDGKWYIVVSM